METLSIPGFAVDFSQCLLSSLYQYEGVCGETLVNRVAVSRVEEAVVVRYIR